MSPDVGTATVIQTPKHGKILNVLQWPHPALSRSCRGNDLDREARHHLAELMAATVRYHDGAGLAAPQVGVSVPLFVIDRSLCQDALTLERVSATANDWVPSRQPPSVFWSPKVMPISEERQRDSEGCLSLMIVKRRERKFASVHVERYAAVRVNAYDLDGTPFRLTARDTLARAIQHENDHLDGVTIMDLAGSVQREMIARKMRATRKTMARIRKAHVRQEGR